MAYKTDATRPPPLTVQMTQPTLPPSIAAAAPAAVRHLMTSSGCSRQPAQMTAANNAVRLWWAVIIQSDLNSSNSRSCIPAMPGSACAASAQAQDASCNRPSPVSAMTMDAGVKNSPWNTPEYNQANRGYSRKRFWHLSTPQPASVVASKSATATLRPNHVAATSTKRSRDASKGAGGFLASHSSCVAILTRLVIAAQA